MLFNCRTFQWGHLFHFRFIRFFKYMLHSSTHSFDYHTFIITTYYNNANCIHWNSLLSIVLVEHNLCNYSHGNLGLVFSSYFALVLGLWNVYDFDFLLFKRIKKTTCIIVTMFTNSSLTNIGNITYFCMHTYAEHTQVSKSSHFKHILVL